MNFVFYDLIFLAIFGIFLAWFFIPRWKKVQREGILFLYKTKLGLQAIDYIGTKYKKFLNWVEYLPIITGYGLMATMLFLLFYLVKWFLNPEFVKAVKIPPIAPLIPYLPQLFKADYLPPFYFAYWIIVLGITIVCHEFFHGIFARARDIKIKSTGFAFLGPFAGAFVEPDEDKVRKSGIRAQLGVLSSGSFANVIVTGIFLLLMWGFFVSAFIPSGMVYGYVYTSINISDIEEVGSSFIIEFNGAINLTEIESGGEKYFITNDSLEDIKNTSATQVRVYEDAPALRHKLAGPIVEFDGKKISNYTDFLNVILEKKPYENVSIKTSLDGKEKEYEVQLAENPWDNDKAYLGIVIINIQAMETSSLMGKIRSKIVFFKDPNTYYKPKILDELTVFTYNLIWWLILVNISVCMVNMLPLGIFDGGRFFYLTVLGITKSERVAKAAFKFSTYFLLFVFFALTYLWFVNTFIS